MSGQETEGVKVGSAQQMNLGFNYRIEMCFNMKSLFP